jgi:hypothetical protein
MAHYDLNTIKAAHKHCSRHYTEVQESDICGCFYCLRTFKPQEILDWIEEEQFESTALCAKCGIDSVIGSKSGYPVHDERFLREMCDYWFSAAS